VLHHLACHAKMASCLAITFWKAIVLGSRWFGGKGVEVVLQARSMQRQMPAIKVAPFDGNEDVSENEKLCVNIVQNSRERDCPGFWLK